MNSAATNCLRPITKERIHFYKKIKCGMIRFHFKVVYFVRVNTIYCTCIRMYFISNEANILLSALLDFGNGLMQVICLNIYMV